jgi:hypothetical protein
LKVGIKIPLPSCYVHSTKLKDFKDFIFNVLCWLKLNRMLGAGNSEWQLTLLGTCPDWQSPGVVHEKHGVTHMGSPTLEPGGCNPWPPMKVPAYANA